MALTVVGCETEIVGRLLGKLNRVGMSVATDETNLDAIACTRKGLSYLGLSPADPTTVVDADLVNVKGFACEKLFDSATLEYLYRILGQCSGVDVKAGDNELYLSQLADEVQAEIKQYEARLIKPYGPMVPTGAMGHMVDPIRPEPHFPHRWGWGPIC